jgi:CDP-glycerol glycerophosphotransferase
LYPALGILTSVVNFTFFTNTLSYSAINFSLVYPLLGKVCNHKIFSKFDVYKNKGKRYLILLYTKIFKFRDYKNNGKWVFGEWFGNRCCDNCLFFANYITANYPQINCVWIAKEGTDLSCLDKNIERLKMDSTEAINTIKNAEVLFMNQGIGDVTENIDAIIKGPLTINFWHGVPWKKIGLDEIKTKNPLKRLYYKIQIALLAPDYYTSMSNEYSEIFKRAWCVKESSLIKAGSPRNSIFYSKEAVSNAKAKICKQLNLSINTRIITYMPTFRDGDVETFSFSTVRNNKGLIDILEKNNAIIVEKSHYAENKSSHEKNGRRIIFGNDLVAQELLAATDVLITDYSSCFFDYLILNRPIIHYLYDYDFYVNENRGLYYKKEDVICGACPDTFDNLLVAINIAIDNPSKDADLRKKRIKQYLNYESSDSCKRITTFILEKTNKN